MPKPVKPYNPAKIGQEVQINYAFLEKLFGSKQKAFRESFFKCKTLTDLRHKLARQNVIVKGRIRIILVDVENARMKSFGSIHHDYYLLLMPPVPRREKSEDYKDAQAWDGAWYHAIVDGYGM